MEMKSKHTKMVTTYYAATMKELADGIMAKLGNPGLTVGPHPRSPAEAHRKGVIEGLESATSIVRNTIIIPNETDHEGRD